MSSEVLVVLAQSVPAGCGIDIPTEDHLNIYSGFARFGLFANIENSLKV
jgi:hypothetical protein